MNLKKIISIENQKLSTLLEKNINIAYSGVQKIIRSKDVKVNGKRVSSDFVINSGDLVEVYYSEVKIKIIYEDKDIVVVCKPRKIETVNDTGDDLKTKVSNQIKQDIYAVHRLDRNTEGLVIFAKNIESKDSLDVAIKNRDLKKYYLAKVIGVPQKAEDKLVAYLKKDEKKSFVYVSDFPQNGYEEIKTNYSLIENDGNFSMLEVELVTGKTHQIRAHLGHIGFPILGDEKYGNSEINKKHGKKYQCLCAYKLKFNFKQGDYLSRLHGLVVELDRKEISFL